MASYLVISKASSRAVLPFISIKAIGCPKSFQSHRAISTALNINHHPKHSSRSSLQSHHYATASNAGEQAKKLVDENLVRLVNSQIKTLNSKVKDIPKGFPFKVENNVEEETLLLTREYPNEIIKVEVKMSHLESEDGSSSNALNDEAESDNNDDGEDDSSDDSDDDSDNYSDQEDSHSDSTDSDHDDECTKSGFPMVVKVSKPESSLEFNATVFLEEISIQSLTIKEKNNSTDHVEGKDFSALNEQLQDGLRKFLEIRGINPNLAEFLNKNEVNMNHQGELEWLKKLNKFLN